MAVQVSNRAPQHLISNPLPLRLRRGQELTFNTDIGTPDDRGTHVLGINRQSLGFPPGFGGWSVRSSYHVTPTEETSGELREKLTRNQYQVYLGWVNAQLKKRKEPQLITDLQADLADGTILADLIEVVAGEQVEMISNPASHVEKVTNVDRVLRFMKANRIPMHPIRAEDIVSGDVRSIMRLILALAARYKPNTVRQTSRHANQKTSSSQMSVVGYAQSAVAALADARRSASVVVPKPKKPGSLNDRVDVAGVITSSERSHVSGNNTTQPGHHGSRSSSTSFVSSQSIPKSSSQDFNTLQTSPRRPSAIGSRIKKGFKKAGRGRQGAR